MERVRIARSIEEYIEKRTTELRASVVVIDCMGTKRVHVLAPNNTCGVLNQICSDILSYFNDEFFHAAFSVAEQSFADDELLESSR